SEEARLEALADPSSFGDIDENDPASMARWMKKMGKEMGEDLGDDLDQAVEEELASGPGSDKPTDTGGDDGDL
ncbi:MAG: zinc ribbon domain-containing protein, partial [Acidobacteria bacterium]|nr:zinc ribbon domain-containing protein [Acidobacteriota bacterium]